MKNCLFYWNLELVGESALPWLDLAALPEQAKLPTHGRPPWLSPAEEPRAAEVCAGWRLQLRGPLGAL